MSEIVIDKKESIIICLQMFKIYLSILFLTTVNLLFENNSLVVIFEIYLSSVSSFNESCITKICITKSRV